MTKKKNIKRWWIKNNVFRIYLFYFSLFLYQTISMLIFGYYVCNSMSIVHTHKKHTHTHPPSQPTCCVGRLTSISVSELPSPSPFSHSHRNLHLDSWNPISERIRLPLKTLEHLFFYQLWFDSRLQVNEHLITWIRLTYRSRHQWFVA